MLVSILILNDFLISPLSGLNVLNGKVAQTGPGGPWKPLSVGADFLSTSEP